MVASRAPPARQRDHLAMGGLGAVIATAPVEFALAYTDWRGLFSSQASPSRSGSHFLGRPDARHAVAARHGGRPSLARSGVQGAGCSCALRLS